MIRCGIINDRQRYGYKKNVCCLTNEQINQPTNNRCDCVFNIELIFVPCRIIISGHLCMHFFLHEIRDKLLENFAAEFSIETENTRGRIKFKYYLSSHYFFYCLKLIRCKILPKNSYSGL